MQTELKRIFVPNLPESLTEDEVRQRFFKFGDLTSVEIKHRKDLNSRNFSHKYAFVNINTNHQLLQQCFDEFAKKKWHGDYVEIQVAKESFLARLQKEREEAQKQTSETVPIPKDVSNTTGPSVLFTSTSRKRIASDVSEEEETIVDTSPKKKTKFDLGLREPPNVVESESSDDGDEVDSDKDIIISNPVYLDVIIKNNLYKQRTNKIEGFGLAPVHVPKQELKRKSKDPYREKADQKRINSMMKMKQGYMQQKSLIKNALSNIDGKSNTKIVFQDDDSQTIEEDFVGEVALNKKTEKLVLFAGDDEEEASSALPTGNFKLREQFEGKKGKKLFELQTRFNQDERFKMDGRFAEGESDGDEDDVANDDENANEEGDVEAERALQMKVLGEVLKKPIGQANDKDKTRKTMMRFDPSQPEHSKYEIPTDKEKKRKRNGDEDKKEKIVEKLPEVSAETFYELNEKIPFQEPGEGEAFSFLKSFGRDNEENDDKEDTANHEEQQLTSKSKNKNGENPFKYDSSDGEEESDDDKAKEDDDKQEKQSTLPENLVSLGRGQLWTESFFFKKDDYRFQEGIDFVKRMYGMEEDEDFAKVRQDLKKIVKRKVGSYQKKKTAFRKKLGSSKKRHNRVTKALQRTSR